MKIRKNLLGLLVVTGILMITCGNEPPPDFYEGTPEDSAAIAEELASHAGYLLTTDICVAAFCSLDVAPVEWVLNDSFFRADSHPIKQHCTTRSDSVTALTRFQDYWFAKDTTCTVYLFDTFTVFSQYSWDYRFTATYDESIFVIDTTIDTTVVPWDTTIDSTFTGMTIGTVDTNSAGGLAELTGVVGEGLRHLFVEPLRDTVDTLHPLIEPRVWALKRVSYGNYYFPARGAEYPTMGSVIITRADEITVDTIFASNNDTLFTGHAMNRLKAIDSLLTFTNGETLDVEITINSLNVPEDMTLFFVCCNGVRKQLTDVDSKFVITGSGLVNLYFEVIHEDSYYYVVPEPEYRARIWLIPVIVQ